MSVDEKPVAKGQLERAAPLAQFFTEIAPLSAKQRLDRIVSRKDTMRVVRAMPVVDLYATVRDVGVEDCLEVLELMSPAQVQGFLDLDGWRKDRVDATAMSRWVGAFFASNPDRAVGQLRGLDLELLTLIVKIHCTIYDLSLEEEPQGEVGRHSITPDQRYLIVYGGVGGDDEAQATLQQAIERLMGRDIWFVLRLCEAVRSELPSGLEEDALRWRNARLADLGFLPADEAAEIFAWLDPDKPVVEKITAVGPPESVDESTSVDLTTSPLLPWDLLSDGSSVFSHALRTVDESTRHRVQYELMLVANRVHAADAADLGDSDALKETARHVAATAGTGLAWLVRGDESQLAARLTSTSVMLLFRTGHSLGLKLRSELKALLNTRGSGLNGRGLLRLDAPLREVVAGLLRVRPLLFGGLLSPKRVDYRPISSLTELAAAAGAVSEAAFRAALLDRLGANDGVFTDVEDARLPTHAALLGTVLGRAMIGEPLTITSFSDAHILGLRDRFASADVDAHIATALSAFEAHVRTLGPLPGAPTSDDVVVRARAYATKVLAAVREELHAVTERRPDGRFLSTLWVG
jgi:hypothetical protein